MMENRIASLIALEEYVSTYSSRYSNKVVNLYHTRSVDEAL